MKRLITILLFFIFVLTGCQNKNLSPRNDQQETSLSGISDTFNEVSTSQNTDEEYTGTMPKSTNLSEISSVQENVHITKAQDLFVVPGNGLTEEVFDRKDFGKGNKFEINYFSVGNADAALVECEGHYMMIDCGTKKNGNRDSYVIDRFLQEKMLQNSTILFVLTLMMTIIMCSLIFLRVIQSQENTIVFYAQPKLIKIRPLSLMNFVNL